MADEKIVLEFKELETKELEYNDKKFQLRSQLSIPEQIFLIKRYIEDYFGDSGGLIPESPQNFFEAEYNQINYILQILTNIDPGEGFVSAFYGDDSFLDSLKEEIVNYAHFRERQNIIIQEIKEAFVIENSLGVILENLIEKLYGILEKFSDVTPEEIDKLQEKGAELLKELESSSIIKDATKKEE